MVLLEIILVRELNEYMSLEELEKEGLGFEIYKDPK